MNVDERFSRWIFLDFSLSEYFTKNFERLVDYGCLRLSVSNFVEFFENLSSLVEDRWGKMSLQKRVNRRTIQNYSEELFSVRVLTRCKVCTKKIELSNFEQVGKQLTSN